MPDALDKLLVKQTPEVDERLKDGPPCLQVLLRQGFPEGTRNNGLFNLGVYLRKAYPDDWETKILEYNQAIMDPPLDLKRLTLSLLSCIRKTISTNVKTSQFAIFAIGTVAVLAGMVSEATSIPQALRTFVNTILSHLSGS
jgi:hypothetical protein